MTRIRRALERALAPVCLLATLCTCRSERAWEIEPPPPRPARGMVVSQHAIASKVGIEILDRGGNAVDAAVATALALAVVFPEAGNLGGGGFAVVSPERGEPQTLDFRETAPSTTTRDLYLDEKGAFVPSRSLEGPLAVGVPGSPAGLWALATKLGSQRLEFRDLVQPAIELAEKGFRVDARLAQDLADPNTARKLAASPAAQRIFYPRGAPLKEGDVLVQTELAETLRRYAAGGPNAFYKGEIARRTAAELARALAPNDAPPRGVVSLDDLESYQPIWRAPLRGWFRGMEVITIAPPSSGGIILLQTLGVLDGFPIESERANVLEEQRVTGRVACEAGGLDARILHWWVEALRRAYAERAAHVGDPGFVAVPTDELVSGEWIARARVDIGEQARPDIASSIDAAHEGSNTTHISVLDAEGNAVSLTTTLNAEFGSGVMVDGAGFLLNDELDDFSFAGSANHYGLVGGAANEIAPKKRPLSTMTPTIVRQSDRRVHLVLGSPGGPRIATAVIAVILRTCVFGQTLAEAVKAPRFHQQWSPPTTDFESGWPEAVLAGLERRGHALRRDVASWGSIQAIAVGDDGEPIGVTDPRSPGAALASKARER